MRFAFPPYRSAWRVKYRGGWYETVYVVVLLIALNLARDRFDRSLLAGATFFAAVPVAQMDDRRGGSLPRRG